MTNQPNPTVIEQDAAEDSAILALLLLETSHRPWAVEEVAREMGRDVADSLARLYGGGLIHRFDGFVWSLARPCSLMKSPHSRYDQTMPDRSRRPRDPNQLGKLIVGIATGEVQDAPTDGGKNPAAVELGRKGGLKGGKARAASMTPEQRKEAAQKAARARWDQGK